jgi:hypothetical protein
VSDAKRGRKLAMEDLSHETTLAAAEEEKEDGEVCLQQQVSTSLSSSSQSSRSAVGMLLVSSAELRKERDEALAQIKQLEVLLRKEQACVRFDRAQVEQFGSVERALVSIADTLRSLPKAAPPPEATASTVHSMMCAALAMGNPVTFEKSVGEALGSECNRELSERIKVSGPWRKRSSSNGSVQTMEQVIHKERKGRSDANAKIHEILRTVEQLTVERESVSERAQQQLPAKSPVCRWQSILSGFMTC